MIATIVGLVAAMYSPAAGTYPNPGILVDADTLVQQLKRDGKKIAIIDARGGSNYARGHIPGAITLPVRDWSKAVPDTPAAWSKRLAALGLTPHTPIVVYSGSDVRESARAWWLLKYAGAVNVRLLNGGWPAWTKAGGTTETKANKPQPIEPAKVAGKSGRLAQKKDVLADLKNKKAQILDARSEGEYCGSGDPHTGHIPGAVHLEWSELLDKDKKFKSPEELKKLLAEKKVDLDRPAITYCQSGGRAAVLAFGLELMGARDVRNYYKSWAEWGSAQGHAGRSE